MKKKSLIISCIILLLLVDTFYVLTLYKFNNYINISLIVNYEKLLFRLIYVINLLLVSYVISSLINLKKDIVSIRVINIEDGVVLFSTQSKKNMELYTDLKKYYIYESKSNKFIIDRFYQIDRNKYGEIKKSKKKGFPEAYDLHKYKIQDFR